MPAAVFEIFSFHAIFEALQLSTVNFVFPHYRCLHPRVYTQNSKRSNGVIMSNSSNKNSILFSRFEEKSGL